MVTQPTTAQGKINVINIIVVNINTKIEVAATDVVEDADIGGKQGEEERDEGEEVEEEVVMVVCPSVYTLLLEHATRMFCISLLG